MHGLKELRSLLNDVQEKRSLKVFDEPKDDYVGVV